MLVGKCTKCEKRYVGWALYSPEQQTCDNCGTRLIIRNMAESYQVDSETLAASEITGKEEWQQSLENTLPDFLL